jgi:hypothetical protein
VQEREGEGEGEGGGGGRGREREHEQAVLPAGSELSTGVRHPEWRQKDPQAKSSSGWPAGSPLLEFACCSND